MSGNYIVKDFFSHGFRCVVARGGPREQNFNGYIEVPASHPDFAADYMEVAGDYDVHGGLTYSGCFLPRGGKDSSGWWFGFDTCHAGDMVVGLRSSVEFGGIFRDEEYVTAELIGLAKQLAEKGVAS